MTGLAVQQREEEKKKSAKQTGELLNLVRFSIFFSLTPTPKQKRDDPS
jgi:hypothetical protein